VRRGSEGEIESEVVMAKSGKAFGVEGLKKDRVTRRDAAVRSRARGSLAKPVLSPIDRWCWCCFSGVGKLGYSGVGLGNTTKMRVALTHSSPG